MQFINGLSYTLSSATRSSSASVSVSADIHHTDISGDPAISGIADPRLSANFTRRAASSELRLNGDILIADQDIDFSDNVGARHDTNLGASFKFGTGQPFGGTLAASHSQSRYDDPDDDDQTNSLSANLSLQTSPNLTVRPSVSLTRYEADETVETTEFGVGFTATLTDVSSINGAINQTEIDVDGTNESRGTTGFLSFVREGQNSTHTFTLSTDVSIEGARTSLSYDRAMQLDDTNANYGFGFARGADDSQTWTANVNLSRSLGTQSFGVNFARDFTTDVEGIETLNSTFGRHLTRRTSVTRRRLMFPWIFRSKMSPVEAKAAMAA